VIEPTIVSNLGISEPEPGERVFYRLGSEAHPSLIGAVRGAIVVWARGLTARLYVFADDADTGAGAPYYVTAEYGKGAGRWHRR
jgi:hypothetical protein